MNDEEIKKHIEKVVDEKLTRLVNQKIRARFRKRDREEKMKGVVKKANLVRCLAHESLMLFDNDKEDKDYRFCFGVGTTTKIVRGESCDKVYIRFGRSYGEEIFVYDNIARRQLLTIVKGHRTLFYGKIKFFQQEKVCKVFFIALGLMDWYTPRALDIKKKVKEGEIDYGVYEEMKADEEKEMLQFIDLFKNDTEKNND